MNGSSKTWRRMVEVGWMDTGWRVHTHLQAGCSRFESRQMRVSAASGRIGLVPCCCAVAVAARSGRAVLCCAVPCRAKLRSEHLSARHQKAQPDQGLCPQSSALPRLCRGNSLDCDFQTVEPSARSCFGAQSIECVAKAFMLADHRSKLLPAHKQPGPQS